ncbi:hypothetical protein L2E82_35784 [Cichorium intybus]|uniref:Uncharacterized protein n=1 Tax=Cichorium intybus TaxID=13427 RepID=A0ACB9BPT6_CICIN|nr:hypothetical protein L2E82_35784 [Cichorium intybus]
MVLGTMNVLYQDYQSDGHYSLATYASNGVSFNYSARSEPCSVIFNFATWKAKQSYRFKDDDTVKNRNEL